MDATKNVIRRIMIGTVLPVLLTGFLFVLAIFLFLIPTMRRSLVNEKQQTAKEMVGAAISLIQQYKERSDSGELSVEDAQRKALELLEVMRYGSDNKHYFWVNRGDYVMLMHPYRKDLVGRRLQHLRDKNEKEFLQEFVDTAKREEDGGFVKYYWQWQDNPDLILSKESYVKLFEPWDWVVGSGLYLDSIEKEVNEIYRGTYRYIYLVFFVFLFVTIYLVYHGIVTEKSLAFAKRDAKEREMSFQAVFNSTFELMGVLDKNGMVIEVNNTALDMIGKKQSDVVGKKIWETPWWSHSESLRNTLIQAIDDARDGRFSRFETEHIDLKGELRQFDFSVKPQMDENDNVFRLLVEGRDITERHKLQKQLAHMQKMESLGRLAGGIAHDFNNLLTCVHGYADLMRLEYNENESVSQSAEEILKATRSARELTSRLLTFSKMEPTSSEPVDMHKLIVEVVGLLKQTIDKRIELKLSLDADKHWVSGDSNLLENAIMNLALNSRDAMPDGGRLTFATRNCFVLEEDGVPIEGEHFELVVSDTGEGIPKDIQERIFDPFFTTKEAGKGTGLGLSTVYATIKNHYGVIKVDSDRGEGASFKMSLPLYEEENVAKVALQAEMKINFKTRSNGHAKVLVVDDEELVRSVMGRVLHLFGHEAIFAEDGVEAIEIFEKEHETINCVVLDMMMPKMNGVDAFKKLREIDPGVKVLVVTGYCEDVNFEEMLRGGGGDVIRKPFDIQTLSEKLQALI